MDSESFQTSIIDIAMAEIAELDDETKKELIEVLKELHSCGMISYKTLLFNLDENLLQECGILNTMVTRERIDPAAKGDKQ